MAFVGLLVSACSFTPNQITADSARFNAMIVVVRGVVRLAPHEGVLCESKAQATALQSSLDSDGCRSDIRNYERYCLAIANPELLLKNSVTINSKMLVLRGKIIDSKRSKSVVDPNDCSLRAAIVIDNAALAQRYNLPLSR